MSNFTDELQRAEEYLKPESYDLCSILCGKTMELILKKLLSSYLQEITPEKQMVITSALAPIRKQSINSLTLGEIANIFEKYTIIPSFMAIRTTAIEDRQFPDLRILVKIRNKATHVNVTDSKTNNANFEKSDAYVMYGNVLKLATIADQLVSQTPRKTGVEQVTVSQQEIAPPRLQTLSVKAAPQPMPQGNMLTLNKNKQSGKYFIFLEEEEEVKGKILLVIPTGQIKALAKSLFEPAFEEEEKEAIRSGKISREQIKSYHDYKGDEEPLSRPIKTIKTEPREPVIDTPVPHDPKPDDPRETFTYKVGGAKALMVCRPSGYFILEGSTAVRQERPSIHDNVQRIRKELLHKNILVPDNNPNLLKFTQDENFDSPSAASGVISGSSTNGWICFKLPNGKTLKQVKRRERP